MEAKKCYVCGKTPLSKDEVGLTKKIIDKKATSFYCLPCLSEYLEVTEDELLAKIEEFKTRVALCSSEVFADEASYLCR